VDLLDGGVGAGARLYDRGSRPDDVEDASAGGVEPAVALLGPGVVDVDAGWDVLEAGDLVPLG
jgi:hypothetical protein